MYLPSDPGILLSLINTKLRDEFSSLDDLCDSLDIDKEELIKAIESYSKRDRRFGDAK